MPAETDPAPAPAPKATEPATEPATDPAPANDPPPEPASQEPKASDNSDPQPAPAAEPDPALDVDITKIGESDEAKQQAAKQQAAADFAAYAKTAGFEDGVKDLLLAKGENGAPDKTLPAREVEAILSAMQRAGVDAGNAKHTLSMIAAVDQMRAKDAEASYSQTLRRIREETHKEFGDGLAAASRDMVAGGVALFGADYWAELCGEPLLTNDKRFVRALAAYGARVRNDNGGPAGRSAGATPPTGKIVFDLAEFSKGTLPPR